MRAYLVIIASIYIATTSASAIPNEVPIRSNLPEFGCDGEIIIPTRDSELITTTDSGMWKAQQQQQHVQKEDKDEEEVVVASVSSSLSYKEKALPLSKRGDKAKWQTSLEQMKYQKGQNEKSAEYWGKQGSRKGAKECEAAYKDAANKYAALETSIQSFISSGLKPKTKEQELLANMQKAVDAAKHAHDIIPKRPGARR